jgi:hypothetical protein
MRLRRIARPLARKGLSVIVAFLLSEFPNFRWDLERRVTPVEIAADRNRSIVAVETQKRPKNIMVVVTVAIEEATGDVNRGL